MKYKGIIICLILACIVLIYNGNYAKASETQRYGLKSQGMIRFTNNTSDTADDIVFYASDLYNLARKCQ